MKRLMLAAACVLLCVDVAFGHELFGMHLQNNLAFEQEFNAMERLGVTWVPAHSVVERRAARGSVRLDVLGSDD